jgi:signal transduction histidine kinase
VPGDEESARFLGFAAGVAHQVNNRLNIVSGWSQVALRRREGDRAALEALTAAALEASEAAAQFQRLAAMRNGEEER